MTARKTSRHRRGHAASRPKKRRKERRARIGALTLGAGGVALASAVGAGELMVGAFVAYVAYRVLRYGVSPTAAIIEGVELEHGELPKEATKAA